MNDLTHPSRVLHWTQWLLIWMAIGLGAGRIISAEKADAKSPLFSANDRSRWAMVLALVDHRRFEIDDVIKRADGRRTKWHTIDLVQHRGRDGRQHYYSSKPPFLPVLVAMQYAMVSATGLSLEEDTSYVIRMLLLTSNLIPFLVFLLATRHLVNRASENEATRLLVIATAGFGTLLTPFLITLNNHLPAAIAVAVVLVFAAEILRREDPPWWLFPPVGLFAAFTVANELPALAFFAFVGAILAWKSFSKTLVGFLPAALVVAAAYFGLNYVAHNDWIPPYAHRRDGREIGRIDSDLRSQFNEGEAVGQQAMEPLSAIIGEKATDEAVCFRAIENRWSVEITPSQKRFAIVDDGGNGLAVREWGNWYDYPGSYWLGEKQGVDRGEPSRAVYAFHALLGHHGIFSLTPIWLVSLLGLVMMIGQGGDRAKLALLIAALSVIVVGFYIARPEIDRNYGGVSCGFRWSFWLIPLWLLPLAPALDWLTRRRWGAALAVALLAVSIASAHYAAANPWRHPWLFDYWTTIGWIDYS